MAMDPDKLRSENRWVALDPWIHGLLFIVIVAFPILLSALTASIAFERAKSVEFCGSCHAMAPFVNNIKNPNSDLLAAKHYQYRRINHNQCYTCHTDYDFLGPFNAKVRGLRHLVAYYGGSKRAPRLYKPFSNKSCLQCHEGAKSFVAKEIHQTMMEQIASDEAKCVSCHGPVHPPRENQQ